MSFIKPLSLGETRWKQLAKPRLMNANDCVNHQFQQQCPSKHAVNCSKKSLFDAIFFKLFVGPYVTTPPVMLAAEQEET